MPSDTPFRYLMRVRYGECDGQGVVFNPRYGEYVDLACFEFLRAALPNNFDCTKGQFEVMVAKQTTEWKRSCRFDDLLEITTTVPHIGNTSFTLRFEIRVKGDPDVRVACDSIYVHVIDQGRHNFVKAPIPEPCRVGLERAARGRMFDQAGMRDGHG